MKKFKIAIIGATGFAENRMLPELRHSEQCTVTAMQGRDSEKISKIAKTFNIGRCYIDIEDMLRADTYDLVYIATPPSLHVEQVRACLESGNVGHILCEKPLIVHSRDLAPLEAFLRYDTSLFVGHHIRHQRAIADLKELIESETIGKVVFVEGQWNYMLQPDARYAKWKLDQSQGGVSAMGDAGIHVVDIVYLLFGKPKQVSAAGSSVLYASTIDTVTAVFEYDSMQAVIRASQAVQYSKNDLVIVGTKGRIEIPNCFSQTFIQSIIIETESGIEKKEYPETLLYRNEIENILNVRTEGVPATTLAEGIEETKILLKINEFVSRERE